MIISEYTDYNEQEILSLYASVGWTNYTHFPERLREGFANSLCVLAAYDNQELLGLIRVVGDGHTIVFIQDILVSPLYQRQGIGTMLLKSIIEKFDAVYQMELLTDATDKTIAFYQSLGFKPVETINACAFIKYP